MPRLYSIGRLLCTLAAAAACSDPDQASLPPAQFAIDSTRLTLDNGLEVAIVPDHGVPTVTALMAFRSGAFVEDETQSGHSHLLEHMLWKGSTEVPDPKLFREKLRALGAQTNATTGESLMTYYQVLPRENLDAGLALLAPALREPLLDAESLANEIEVVLAEFDRADSDWSSVQYRRVEQLLYGGQSNRKDPLGRREVIRAATPDMLRQLHATYHVPNNGLLLLVGDVTAEDGEELARRHFDRWASAPDPFAAHPVPEPVPLSSNVVEQLEADVSASYLQVSFLGPDARTDFQGAVAADVFSAMSALNHSQFRKIIGAPAILGAGLGHSPARDRGMLTIGVTIEAGHEVEAIERLREALVELPTSIDTGDLAAAQDEIWAGRFFGSEPNLTLASTLARGWAYRDLDYNADYLATLYTIDRADILDLISHYMREKPYVAVLRTPQGQDAAAALARMRHLWQ